MVSIVILLSFISSPRWFANYFVMQWGEYVSCFLVVGMARSQVQQSINLCGLKAFCSAIVHMSVSRPIKLHDVCIDIAHG